MTINRKFKDAVTVKLPTKLVLISNELPRFDDASGALASRIILLPLTESFYNREDPTLTDRLLRERSGILLWTIEGWKRLRDRGFFEQPESAKELMGEMEELSSHIRAFVRECCKVGPLEEVSRDELYRAYLLWCEEKGIRRPVQNNTFGRDLRAIVPTIRDKQPRSGDGRVRLYVGISLLSRRI